MDTGSKPAYLLIHPANSGNTACSVVLLLLYWGAEILLRDQQDEKEQRYAAHP